MTLVSLLGVHTYSKAAATVVAAWNQGSLGV